MNFGLVEESSTNLSCYIFEIVNSRTYTRPKNFSKNSISRAMIPCFFCVLLPPPKRDIYRH